MDDCSEHSDCGEGRKCINLYCGEEKYYEALEEMSCDSDQFCKVGGDKTREIIFSGLDYFIFRTC